MSSPDLRQITRDKLFAVFKSWELVKLIESLLFAVDNTLPGASEAVQAALDAHVADAGDAHQASAIGFTPTGALLSNQVQAALAEVADLLAGDATQLSDHETLLTGLEANKVPNTREVNGQTLSADVTLTASDVGAQPADANLDDWAAKTAPVSSVVGTTDAQALENKSLLDPTITGTLTSEQGAPTSKAAGATLTIAELLTGIIQYTGAAATLTLPTGTDIDTGFPMAADYAFEFCVINTGAGAAAIGTAAGLTLVGSMSVATSTSARFRARKTGSNTFTVYRIA